MPAKHSDSPLDDRILAAVNMAQEIAAPLVADSVRLFLLPYGNDGDDEACSSE
jgi:hypothetical protein